MLEVKLLLAAYRYKLSYKYLSKHINNKIRKHKFLKANKFLLFEFGI